VNTTWMGHVREGAVKSKLTLYGDLPALRDCVGSLPQSICTIMKKKTDHFSSVRVIEQIIWEEGWS
jgi:hypothetical protein